MRCRFRLWDLCIFQLGIALMCVPHALVRHGMVLPLVFIPFILLNVVEANKMHADKWLFVALLVACPSSGCAALTMLAEGCIVHSLLPEAYGIFSFYAGLKLVLSVVKPSNP